jgi:hypothetical protein
MTQFPQNIMAIEITLLVPQNGKTTTILVLMMIAQIELASMLMLAIVISIMSTLIISLKVKENFPSIIRYPIVTILTIAIIIT